MSTDLWNASSVPLGGDCWLLAAGWEGVPWCTGTFITFHGKLSGSLRNHEKLQEKGERYGKWLLASCFLGFLWRGFQKLRNHFPAVYWKFQVFVKYHVSWGQDRRIKRCVVWFLSPLSFTVPEGEALCFPSKASGAEAALDQATSCVRFSTVISSKPNYRVITSLIYPNRSKSIPSLWCLRKVQTLSRCRLKLGPSVAPDAVDGRRRWSQRLHFMALTCSRAGSELLTVDLQPMVRTSRKDENTHHSISIAYQTCPVFRAF